MTEKKRSPLWEFVDALGRYKRDVVASGEMAIESYPAFMVTRAFSTFPDTVLAAGEINALGREVDALMHYDYWMGSVRPMRRFSGKWEKTREDHVVDVVMELYGCNRTRAAEVVWTLGSAEAAKLVEKYENELGRS